MIITLTANPSLDRTVELPGILARGEVQRASAVRSEAGGKGVNVSRALAASGLDTLALLPGDANDPVVTALAAAAIPHHALPIGAPLRSNITLTEPDGTTTKVNEPGPELGRDELDALTALVLDEARDAGWVVLAGSLPPGVPADYYARLTRWIRSELGTDAPRIAVDSSGTPLLEAINAGADAAPDLLKPNGEELAELASLAGLPEQHDGAALEADPVLAARAATAVVERGVGAVLATLGSNGAVLVTADGAWHARHAPIKAVSTVGAGDSSLAGYLLVAQNGGTPVERLTQAVAHGAAAASLPGSTVPGLHQTTPSAVTVTALAKDSL
ncbi:1-phosphofructokinase family hexose kinase [Arthrobacter sp. NPDC090010]|uniref:1-phosphofructokinase family hexose kinase n=1 Tax=Arthrobacter sp. NPDC090010 TaxID=3363942 RepID=UPI0038143911